MRKFLCAVEVRDAVLGLCLISLCFVLEAMSCGQEQLLLTVLCLIAFFIFAAAFAISAIVLLERGPQSDSEMQEGIRSIWSILTRILAGIWDKPIANAPKIALRIFDSNAFSER